MASANALMHHRRLQRVKKSSHSDQPEARNSAAGGAEVRIVPVEDSSDSGRALFQRIYFSFVTLKCLLIVKTIQFCGTEMFRVANRYHLNKYLITVCLRN